MDAGAVLLAPGCSTLRPQQEGEALHLSQQGVEVRAEIVGDADDDGDVHDTVHPQQLVSWWFWVRGWREAFGDRSPRRLRCCCRLPRWCDALPTTQAAARGVCLLRRSCGR